MTRKNEEPRITEGSESASNPEEDLAPVESIQRFVNEVDMWESSEVQEPAGSYESNEEGAARAFGKVMDSIGRNLDRTVETLTRLEAKLASAHEH